VDGDAGAMGCKKVDRKMAPGLCLQRRRVEPSCRCCGGHKQTPVYQVVVLRQISLKVSYSNLLVLPCNMMLLAFV
jgi:hypothetical protein